MRSSANIFTDRFVLFVAVMTIVSCDSLTETDSILPEEQVLLEKSEYYILPGSAVIIDLESVVKESFSNATLTISEKPQRGTLTNAATTLLKYRPIRSFESGEDHFVLTVTSDGNVLAKGQVTIVMKGSKDEFPCKLVALEDKVKVGRQTSVSVRVLDNDRFCDIDLSAISISIHTEPKFGQASVDNESIIYTPSIDYKHQDELIYDMKTSAGETIGYGLLSISDLGQITVRKIDGNIIGDDGFTSMFFLDEDTGFLGTSIGLFKTKDGGNTWDVLIRNLAYEQIYFLDEKKGFAAHSGGRLAKTTDGGLTWKLVTNFEKEETDFKKSVTGIFFTSEVTGFVVVVTAGFWDYVETLEILKTADGGASWKVVFSQPAVGPLRGFQFIDDTNGYANLYQGIFMTDDAGESWNVIFDRSLEFWGVSHFYVLHQNKFFGVWDGQYEIFTSQDAFKWRHVAYLSSVIYAIGFSPSGHDGFALIRDHAPESVSVGPSLSIVRTIDQGETWVEEPLDEMLYGYPVGMYFPSNDVVYFLCYDRIIKYSYK